MKKIILIVLCAIFMGGCHDEPQIDLSVFIPSFSVTKKQLLNEGFEVVQGADIPMFYKKIKDTTVVFTFDFDSNNLLSKAWTVPYNDLGDLDCLTSYIKNWDSSTRVMCLSGYFDGITPKNLIYNYKYNQPYEFALDTINKTFSIKYFYFNVAE